MKRILSSLRIALIPALFVTAQTPSSPDLVYVRVAAVERNLNRPMRGLRLEQFKISEDNIPQDIVSFSDESLPLHVGIVLDASRATKADIEARVLTGLTRASGRDDEFLLVELGDAPLNDAVLQTLNTLAQQPKTRKRVLVLFTSRADPGAYVFTKVRERLKEHDILLYVIGLPARSDNSDESGRQMLRDLAELSGGTAFFPASTRELGEISAKIMAELRNQYVVGYRSTNRAPDGKWRKVKITVEQRDKMGKKVVPINIHAKQGYYAPTAVK